MKLLFLTPKSDIQNYLPNLPFVWASLCGIERCKGFSRCFLYFSIVVVVAVLFFWGGGGGGGGGATYQCFLISYALRLLVITSIVFPQSLS